MSNELNANTLAAEVITDLAKRVATSVYNKIKKVYKDTLKKDEVDYRTAYEEYLYMTQNSVSMAKTILYGQVPHHLYTFYECIGIKYQNDIIDTLNVNNILECGHKVIITGTGGIGKSMLMKHLFLSSIDNANLVPVLVELRGLNDYEVKEISIKDFIYHTLKVHKFKLEKEYFEYSLETGCYLILFDGYDEVKNEVSQKVTKEILDFSNQYSDNYFIVSSRPLREFVGWSDYIECESLPLNKSQALSLIKKLDYDEEIKEKFYMQLDTELFDKYESFASNPLLLTIMLMTFEGRVSIPDSKNDFFDQAFSTLFHRHDAMKKGKFKRDKLSKLGYEDFKNVFAYFCFKSFFKSQYEFNEITVLNYIADSKKKIHVTDDFISSDYLLDLTNAVCMLVHDGLNYRFSHRSFQEYFAAVYTTQLGDEEQKQFIGSWLKANNRRMTTDFLDMLCALQPERFFKNVLYTPLFELKRLYEENGSSDDWLLQYLYSGVSIHEDNIYVQVKNSYHHTCFSQALRYSHYRYDDWKNQDEYINVVDNLKKLKSKESCISFKRLEQDGLYKEVVKCIKWVFIRKIVVFKLIDEVNLKTFGKKRKFEAMLDNL